VPSRRRVLVPWMSASHPRLMPTPIWRGERMSAAWLAVMVAKHLDTSRRTTRPTAIGRMPPSFLLAAKSVAPARKGATSSGTLPAAIPLITSLRPSEALALVLGEPVLVRTFRCSARRASCSAWLETLQGLEDLLGAEETW
jgi:hypothetical protein